MGVVIRVAVLIELMHSAHLHTSRHSHVLQLTCKPARYLFIHVTAYYDKSVTN